MLSDKLDCIMSAAYDTGTRESFKKVNENELKNLLMTDYSSAAMKIKTGYEIYRGVSNENTYPLMEVVPGIRVSENVSNIYALLFSEILPSWSKYPKRNRSVICTTSAEKAMSYSSTPENIYLVLPKNDAKIGICGTDDIWDAIDFKSQSSEMPAEYRLEINDLPDFNKSLAFLLECALDIRHPEDIFYSKSGKSAINALNLLDNFVDKESEENIEEMIEQYDNIYVEDNAYKRNAMCMLLGIKESGKTAIGYLNDLMNPHKNGIKLTTIEEFKPQIEDDCEVWTDSPCLMISLAYRDIADKLLEI